jgi:hypothetical protein
MARRGVYKIESTRHKCTKERKYESGTATSPSDLWRNRRVVVGFVSEPPHHHQVYKPVKHSKVYQPQFTWTMRMKRFSLLSRSCPFIYTIWKLCCIFSFKMIYEFGLWINLKKMEGKYMKANKCVNESQWNMKHVILKPLNIL